MADEQPKKTISFNSAQWRDVICGDIVRLHEVIKNRQGPLDTAGLTAIDNHLDGIRTMIGGMNVAAVREAEEAAKAQAAAQQAQVAVPESPLAQTNGAAQVAPPVSEAQVTPITKKKGGWPSGKKRGPRKAKAQVAQ